MEYKALRCPDCGQNKIEKRDEEYHCVYCACTFTEEYAQKALDLLADNIRLSTAGIVDAALQKSKEETFYNLRSSLWAKVHAKYIDSQAIVGICNQLKTIVPNDFPANFYLVANEGTKEEVVDFLHAIDVEEQSIYVERVLEFMFKSMEAEYILPVNQLIERAFKATSLAKYEAYISRLEEEAEKIDSGIYQTEIPRKVFVAYSSKDMDKVVPLVQLLEENGISCFVAMRNLQHGRNAVANYEQALKNAIDNCQTVVFVSSKNSRNFSCDALAKELPYMKNKERNAAPSEYINVPYAQLPERYKKPRVEYRIDDARTLAADEFLKEFFAGLDYCETPEKVLARVVAYLTAEGGQEKAGKPQPQRGEQSSTASMNAGGWKGKLKEAFLGTPNTQSAPRTPARRQMPSQSARQSATSTQTVKYDSKTTPTQMVRESLVAPTAQEEKHTTVETKVPQTTAKGEKSRALAAILGILFGAWGFDQFYLGYHKKGFCRIGATFLLCGIGGALWGIVDGINLLQGKPSVDAEGNPLA